MRPETEARLRAAALTPADIALIMEPSPMPHRYVAHDHADACIDLALKVRAHGGAYPPPDVASTPDAVTGWLANEEYLSRIVVTLDGAVVGHGGLCPAHPYLLDRLPAGPRWAEVTKLYADPEVRRRGVGTVLLTNMQDEARRLGFVAALAVLEVTPAAVHMYEALGWDEVAAFDGIHGRNRVFADMGNTKPRA